MAKKLGSYLESIGVRIPVSGKPYDYGGKIGKKNYTIVSKADAKIVGKRKLYYNSQGYVQTQEGGRRVDLQRFIANRKDGGLRVGLQVDHKNRLRYDNSRGNLRQVNSKTNLANRGISKKGYTGSSTSGAGRLVKLKKDSVFDRLQDSVFFSLSKTLSAKTRTGRKASAATRAKQSQAAKGRTFSAETRAKISAANKGVVGKYKRTASIRKKISKSVAKSR